MLLGRPWLIYFLFGVVLGLTSGCGGKQAHSTLKHDEGRYFNSESPWQWLELTELELKEILLEDGIEAKDAESSLSKRSSRLQWWADQIHKIVLLKNPSMKGKVPQPKVQLIHHDDLNAFAVSVKVCVDAEIMLEGTTAVLSQETGLMLLRDQRKIAEYSAKSRESSCIKRSLPLKEILELVAFQLSVIKDCHPKIEGQKIVLPRGCAAGQTAIGTSSHVSQFIYFATSSTILVYKGLVDQLKEDELVGILAHELAHYYMAHQVTPLSEYGYYYFLTDVTGPSKPAEQRVLYPYKLQVAQELSSSIRSSNLAKVRGQQLHSILFDFARRMVPSFHLAACGTKPECQHPCDDLLKFVDKEDFKILSGIMGLPKLSLQYHLVYEDWETKLKSCTELVPVRKEPSKGALSMRELELLSGIFLAPPVLEIMKHDIQEGTSAWRVLTEYSSRFIKAELEEQERWDKLFGRLHQERVGYYTFEQEADELAVEFLARMGLDPKSLIRAIFKVSSLYDQSIHEQKFNSMNMTECRVLYEKGWKNATGEEVIVPVGDWDNEHHSDCFRIYNMDREIKIHGFDKVSRSVKPQLPSGPAWDDLQKLNP